MRLNKVSLVAAAFALSLPCVSSAVTIGTESYGKQITTVAGQETTLNGAFSGSIKELLGSGDFTMNVQGKLQYLGFQGDDLYFKSVHERGLFTDARVDSETIYDTSSYLPNGMTGNITVNQGTLEVGGYLSAWVQYPRNMTGHPMFDGLVNNAPVGVSGVVLNKGTEINFTNTPLNVLNNLASPLGGAGTTLSRRYNLVRNIKAGANNDQADTTFSAGIDNTYRIVILADNTQAAIDAEAGFGPLTRLGAAGNSIGKLAGAGDVYKFGAGDLRILGESERGIGRFTIANGSVTLASGRGLALATATSVNLAGSDSRQGAAVGEAYDQNPGAANRWKEAYTPNPGTGYLFLESNQTIRNLQADFAYKAGTPEGDAKEVTVNRAVQQAATRDNADEAVVVGTGRGSAIAIGNKTLTIIQDRDGVYRGNIVAETRDGVTGKVVVTGTATLALLLGLPSEAIIGVAEGSSAKLIVNAQGLGTTTVGSRNLLIMQDNAGSLNATVIGSDEIKVIASATLDNGSGTPIQLNENGVAGTLLFAKAQSQFTGAVQAYDGVTLEFSKLADNALITASSVNLHAPTGIGSVTGIRLGDSTQTFKSLNGEAGTQIDLSRGTLILNGNSAFAGKIIGVGNLVSKSGSLVLNGANDTHLGATVVQSGSLGLVNGALQYSSGVVLGSSASFGLGGGAVSVGALFGQTGSRVDLGSGTLTVGTSALRAAQLQQELAGGKPLSTNYLGTSAVAVDLGGRTIANFDTAGLGGVPVDVADATRLFLQNTAYAGSANAAADAARLDFAGTISGNGGLTKIGGERLTLTGVNTYTGVTRVEGGFLRADWDALSGTSGIVIANVAAGAAPAVFEIYSALAEGEVSFTKAIVSEGTGPVLGTLSKVGDGTVSITSSLAKFNGGISVDEGTLLVKDVGNLPGTVSIANGGRLLVNQSQDAVLSGAVTNAGTLEKAGAATLSLKSYAGAGSIIVSQGTLELPVFPVALAPAALTVQSGATLSAALVGTGAPVVVSTQVQGAGTVSIVGSGAAPVLSAAASDLFREATLDLRGNITFDLAGTTQTLAGLTGADTATVALGGGTLVFDLAAGKINDYAGNLSGAGDIVKEGDGVIVLSTKTTQSWTGALDVNAGTLIATPQALGANAVTVNAGGVFALYNPDVANAQTYASTVSGTGILAKTGAGEVILTNGVAGVSGGVLVKEGRLTTGDAGTDAVFAAVEVSSGATFQVNMTGNRLHDSDSADKVTGAGNLAVSGANTLTLAGATQSYTGLTELKAGATLDASAVTTLNGLAGEADTTVLLPAALTLAQNASGTFAGTFVGGGDLRVTGSGRLSVTGDFSGTGAITIDGGHLQVGTTAKDIVLENGGTVYLAPGAYTGTVTGTGDIIKTGAGTLDLADTANFGVTGRFGVEQGVLILRPEALPANLTGLVTLGAGELQLKVDADTPVAAGSPAANITGSGTLAKVGSGRLAFGTVEAPVTLDLTGKLLVREGTLGGNFKTGGALEVLSGATLAPGNSIGTVTVAGDFTNSGTLAIELSGTTSDKVVVAGNATLGGTLAVSQFGATPAVRATRYAFLTAASVSGDFAAVQNTLPGFTGIWVDTKTVPGSVYLVPVQSLSSVAGYTPHDGLGAFLAQLDTLSAPTTTRGNISSPLGLALALTPTADLTRVVNNLSPLGFASEYAMAQDGENHRQALLHDRLEQRRYDRGSPVSTEDAPWEAFVVGGASFADNDNATDTGTFDYRSFGGLVGLDRKVNDDLLLGVAVGYDNGKATLKNDGGKIDMDRAAGTLFMSTQLTKRWYLDVGATAGVGLYESTRNTILGAATGDNTGYSAGLNAETGTVVVLSKEVHLTPYLGLAYTHHEFDGFSESGAPTRLGLDAWSQDSLRAKLGTGLGWFVPLDWAKLKLGLDVAFAHELLDTDSELTARFLDAGTPKFGATAAALPQDAISLSPSVGLQFDETTSATLSYSYEMGLDARSYQSVNFAIRKRF